MHTKQGEIITMPDGQQYFQIGNTRIKITEHFASNGKQVDAILEESRSILPLTGNRLTQFWRN